jgi:hypothetical protein
MRVYSQAETWLKEKYPQHANIVAYWND